MWRERLCKPLLEGLKDNNNFKKRHSNRSRLEIWEAHSPGFWFGSVNSYLHNKMPKDLLKSKPQEVLRTAQIEAAGVQTESLFSALSTRLQVRIGDTPPKIFW
jgi:hypothetical protein